MKNWALITGASSGIGLAIAKELAKRNYNLIIHGRNELALNKLKSELDSSNIEIKIITADLSVMEETKALIQEVRDLPLSIFINNAGFGVAGDYEQTNLDEEFALTNTLVSSPMYMTKELIPILKNSPESYILNVSSLYAFFAVPKQAIYGAAKAFQHSFSKALTRELSHTTISVSSLCPGLTYSQFRTRQGKNEKKHFVGLTSEEVAKIAMNKMFAKKVTIVPGFFNKFMSIVIPNLPDRWAIAIIHKMNSSRGF